MKKIFSLIALFLLLTTGKTAAQADSLSTKPAEKKSGATDTIFTNSNEKISCKVLEIGINEIKYKIADYLDGPTFIIDKARVNYIIFASGIKDVIENTTQPPVTAVAYTPQVLVAMKKYKAVKMEPFALTNSKLILGYEQSLKMGFNLEVKLGYVNSNIAKKNTGYSTYYISNPVVTGGFLKAGIKFTFNQEYRYKNDWYKHPLKGHYLRVNGFATSLRVNYTTNLYQNLNGFTQNNGSYPVDLTVLAYGMMADYGYQFIIANVITFDIYAGLGFATYNRTSSDPHYSTNGYYYYTYSFGSNYYSHFALGTSNNATSGVCFNTGMTFGFAF